MSNETELGAQTAYEQWLRSMHSPAHARRTAERHAAFFLPHLRAGMRLLDVGCGPGSITAGLGTAVGPEGEVVGIDRSFEAIEMARALVSERGCTNVRFEMADVYALPFEDATFDAAFSHAVFQHLQDPLAALRQIRRVLKPGGAIGIADPDHDGSIIWPQDPLIMRSLEMQIELRTMSGGGDARIGKRLRSLLHEAGFPRSAAAVVSEADGAKETTARAGEWQAAYLAAPPFVAQVVALGLATEQELAAMSSAWRAWGASPGAFWARFFCHAVGWRD